MIRSRLQYQSQNNFYDDQGGATTGTHSSRNLMNQPQHHSVKEEAATAEDEAHVHGGITVMGEDGTHNHYVREYNETAEDENDTVRNFRKKVIIQAVVIKV